LRGGKGVATGAGVVFVLLPVPMLAALAAWVLCLCIYRYVSLASLVAAVVLCIAHLTWAQAPFAGEEAILTGFCVVAASLVFLRHRSNITRLLRGNEHRLNERPIMQQITKIVHVLAVGLWFGMTVFFSFPVALTLFGSFEKEAQKTDRPSWFPLPAEYKQNSGVDNFNLQKDQGTRAAGFAISALFGHYFFWQGFCGFLATLTAMNWPSIEPGRFVHRFRVVVLILAVVTVLLGWPIEHKVSDLRHDRNVAADQLMEKLKTDSSALPPLQDLQAQVVDVRADFARWHLWSLLLNMVTIALVTLAMALTAMLPESKKPTPAEGERRQTAQPANDGRVPPGTWGGVGESAPSAPPIAPASPGKDPPMSKENQ
jgi:hypothetical protein